MLSILLALLLSISGPQADAQARDARAIATAKNTSVHRLDASLPDKGLAKWLREVVGPHAPIAWEVNDCGEQTGNPEADKGRDLPICVEAQVTLQKKSKLSISVSVGTIKTGVQRDAVGLAYVVIVGPDGLARSIKKLSQAPEAMKAAP
ncbi:MAG TPA: hypothetical protein VFZ27_17485 [Terriglobia bacterium]|nr:hypothetical protein [Terriglobia bacterium]